jgi:hypothetical protein
VPGEVPFWSTIVPDTVKPLICGVKVSLLAATQYEYFESSWVIVMALLALV